MCICGGSGDVYIDNVCVCVCVCVRAFQGIIKLMIPRPAGISDDINNIRSYTIGYTKKR